MAGTELITVEINEAVVTEDMRAMTEIGIGQAMVMDATEILKRVGRIEGAHFLETVSSRLIVETYIQIKNSKAYKGLPYRNAAGKVETVSTLEEFCEAFMPRSHRRCQQLADAYHLLGPDLYEQAEAIGFRQRDYAALKALPADDQAIVRQAIEAGKLDNAIELMQEMAVKHVQEMAALEAVARDAQEAKVIAERQLEAKDKKINELDAKLSKPAVAAPEYGEAEALAALDKAVQAAVAAIHAPLRIAIQDLMGERGAHQLPRTLRQAIAAGLGRVSLAVKDLGADLDLAANESTGADQGEDQIDAIWAATIAELDAKQAAGEAHETPVQ